MNGLRLKEVRLHNFKAFRDFHAKPGQAINLDADIVLLTGPNGYGKTSLVEAIEALVTERVRQRLGDESDIDNVNDLINKYANTSQASVVFETSEGTMEIKVQGAITSDYATSAMNQIPFNNTDFLRLSAFFYQEDLENLFGVRYEVRNMITRLFIPEWPYEDTLKDFLIKEGQEILTKQIDDLTRKLGDDPEEIRKKEKSLISSLIKQSNIFPEDVRPPFTRIRDGLLDISACNELCQWMQILGVPTAEVITTGQALEQIYSVLGIKQKQDLAGIRKEREEYLKSLKGPLVALQERVKHFPRETFQTKDALDKEIDALQQSTGDMLVIKEQLQKTDERIRRLLHVPDKPWRENLKQFIAVGEIPLLISILYLRQSMDEVDWQKLADRLGIDITGTDWERLLEDALGRLEDAEREVEQLRNRSVELHAAEQRIKVLENLSAEFLELQAAWDEAGLGQMPFIETDEGARYRKSDLLKLLSEKVAGNQRETDIKLQELDKREKAWAILMQMLDEWRQLHFQRLQAEKTADPQLRERINSMKKLSDIIGRGKKAKINNIFHDARAGLLRPYLDDINKMIHRVLQRFRLPQDIQERLRVTLDSRNIMRFSLPAEGGKPARNAFSTFSISQLNQAGIAFMLALNIGAGRMHPLGFICFDDVSAALDPVNLAANALLFRSLAYEERGPKKQLIITSHHDDITTRLLPLLLPPPGCRMKVVEFLSWSEEKGTHVKCHEVIQADENGLNRLEELLRKRSFSY